MGDLGVRGGTTDPHSCTYCSASMQVTSFGRKNLSEALFPPPLPRVWSRRGERAAKLAPRTGPFVQTSGECSSLLHKWTGPGPNHMHWTERGKEEGRKKSRPKLAPPFPLLCNLLINFQWETGALSPREGGGASLLGRMRGEAALSLLPSCGAQVFLLRPKGGEGGRAAKSLAPCATALPLRVRSRVPGVRCGRGSLFLSSVSCP